jgi:CRISPR-associated exonuclease Cas4
MSWLRRRQRLPTSDITEPFVAVTDVKHYIYCPRIVYFERVLHAKPVFGSQQEEGGEKHEEYVRKELRRKDAVYYSPDFIGAQKLLFVNLISPKLGLTGQLDCIIKTVKGEFIPVDYKNMGSNHGKVWMDHKYQLVAYALLVEERYNTIVKRMFVNYIPEKLILEVEITPTMKTHVKRVIGHIKRIISDEKLPPIRVAKRKCTGGCGYRTLCKRSI